MTMKTAPSSSSGAQEWHAAAEYERRVEPFTASFAEELLRPLRAAFPDDDSGPANPRRRRPRLLDVGCGCGLGSSLADDMGFDVTACDASPEMVERAKTRFPHILAVCADGQRLPYRNEFDCAMGAFSVIFFEDPLAGLEGMRDALLDDGGLVAISAWGGPDETPAFQVFPDAVRSTESIPGELSEKFGRPKRITGSPEKLTTLLTDAGFEDVSIEGPVQRHIEVASAEDFYNRFALTSPNTMKLIEQLDDEQKLDLKSRVVQLATERGGNEDGGISIPSSCYFAYGRKKGTLPEQS